MHKRAIWLLPLLFLMLFPMGVAYGQTYYFRVDEYTVNVFWNEDGTASIDHVFVFTNDAFASPIDYVDVGIMNSNFDVSSIYADVDGIPISDISRSGYQGTGDAGVAIGLGPNAVQPGETATVHVFIGTVRDVLYPDTSGDNYVSALFSPTWFGPEYVDGSTNMTIVYHFPVEVQPEEPRWHEAPAGFPDEPQTGFDTDDRIVYIWNNPQASAARQYTFGASFPLDYVPETAIVRQSFLQSLGISTEALVGFTFCGCFGVFFALIITFATRSAQRRKLQYLSPKIAIEGHGIKRGLTAVEAAILLEQPLDKILTMILFSTIKKNAATVVTKDPLELEIVEPLPKDLQPYEVQFLQSFKEKNKTSRKRGLQKMMIELVEDVASKMKGFSRKETLAYYRNIVQRAWEQVETAETPEVKSERFNENLEWTMLDREYEDKTRDVFRTGPVFVPIWWPRYDPVYRGSVSTGKVSTPTTGSGGGVSLPHLPGSDFAASIVTGVQTFAARTVGSITEFTGGVTQKTNPPPVVTSSSSFRGGRGGSSCACACACACAGCACACAGGGR